MRDLRTFLLDPTTGTFNWLNDEVINFYMGMICERSKGPDLPKVYAMSSFFYNKFRGFMGMPA